jgi:hypothetical protein
MNHVYPVCRGANDFDCIMNVELINKDGKSISGKFLEYILAAPLGHGGGNYKGTTWEGTGPPYWYPTKEEVIVNSNGNSGLSKGGSGDALTGMILSFLAQGYLPIEAAQLAVFLHGLAADLTQESQSHESMLISDVIENIGKSFKSIQF